MKKQEDLLVSYENHLIRVKGTYRQPIAASRLISVKNHINMNMEQHKNEWAKQYRPSIFDEIDEILRKRK